MATNDPSIPRLKTAASLLAISAVTQVAILALALPLYLSENFLGVEGDGRRRKSIGAMRKRDGSLLARLQLLLPPQPLRNRSRRRKRLDSSPA
jgi:hypothetical protein